MRTYTLLLALLLSGCQGEIQIESKNNKNTGRRYTVIASGGVTYYNLSKRYFNDSDFLTKEGKTITFMGNHIVIEE